MENKMILKVYDIDYSFIIKNYLEPKLWEKEWTLFIYKKFIVTLKLKYIYIYNNKIIFEIKLTDNNSKSWNRTRTKEVEYSLKTDNINILKKAINTKIVYAIKELENYLYICSTEEYYKLEQMEDDERGKLREIAEDFLNENNIENENIREAYIEAYIDNTETVYDLKNEYESKMEYKMIPDLYLTFAKTTKNKELEKKVLEKNNDKSEELLEQIAEFEEYLESDEYIEEVSSKLEEL